MLVNNVALTNSLKDGSSHAAFEDYCITTLLLSWRIFAFKFVDQIGGDNMTMSQFRATAVRRLIRLIICSALIFSIAGTNCYADEADFGFVGYPTPPDLSSNEAGPDIFTGTMSYSIPIKVPPGRNGMTPDITLTYRSSNGNGWIGVGWELEMGAIQRSTRWGVDYTNEDDHHSYQLRKAGSTMDLIFAPTDNFYHAKIESEFTRTRKLTDSYGRVYWEATNKSGC